MVADVHDATCRMMWARMAKSGNSREFRMTYDEWLASGEPFGAVAGDEDESPYLRGVGAREIDERVAALYGL